MHVDAVAASHVERAEALMAVLEGGGGGTVEAMAAVAAVMQHAVQVLDALCVRACSSRQERRAVDLVSMGSRSRGCRPFLYVRG